MTQVRGMDSTGILTINGQYQMESYKKAVNASDFIGLARTKALLADVDTNFSTIIHCRKKTLGGSGHEAAHPFVWEDEQGDGEFGMVHNGTLTSWSSAKFESDSHWLSKQMYDDTKGALEKLKGAAALIWNDQRTGLNSFFTNGERPLFYGFLEKEKVLIVGSEAELMYAALTRNNLKLKDNTFTKATPNWLYAFNGGDIEKWDKTEIKKPLPVTTAPRNYGGMYGAYGNNDDWPSNNFYTSDKDRIAKELEALFAEATGSTETTPVNSRPLSFNPTEEEAKAFETYSGVKKTEVMTTISFYDEKNEDLYLTVEALVDYTKGVVVTDIVVMREVKKDYFKYLDATFSELCVCIGGMAVGSNTSMPEFIAVGRQINGGSIKKTSKLPTVVH